MLKIAIEETKTKKEKPDPDNLIFGTVFTDHMFVMDYTIDKGWHGERIIPYQPIVLEPSAMVFHYGQEMFEGLKAYRTKDNRFLLFRPEKNVQRANQSNERICIPTMDEEDMLEAIKALVRIDKDWIPEKEGTSLYIRPFIIATDPVLGVRASNSYKFIVIASPVGPYYKEGINPVKIWVEDEYVRAVKGGVGEAKTGGNYAASLKAQIKANENGYAQVLWLDGLEQKYIEEVGAMNIFFKIDGKIITPELSGSILSGVTRRSVLELCKHWDMEVIERKISIEELYQAYETGKLEEVFGTGTAAVISPVGELRWKDKNMVIQGGQIGPISQKLYQYITGIQTGNIEDLFGWMNEVL